MEGSSSLSAEGARDKPRGRLAVNKPFHRSFTESSLTMKTDKGRKEVSKKTFLVYFGLNSRDNPLLHAEHRMHLYFTWQKHTEVRPRHCKRKDFSTCWL